MKKKELAATFGLALLGAACSGPADMSRQPPLKADGSVSSCIAMGGPDAKVDYFIPPICVGCRVDDPESAGDGDLQSLATMHSDASAAAGIRLRVSRAASPVAAGNHFGAVIRERRSASAATNPYLRLRTFLAGELQEDFAIGASSGVNLSSNDAHRSISAQAQLDFDAIEILLGGPAAAGDLTVDVMEMCARILDAPAPQEEQQAERAFGSARPGSKWTQRLPGQATSAEMQQWFERFEAATDQGVSVTLPVRHYAGEIVGPVMVGTEDQIEVVLSRSAMLDEDSFFQINAQDYFGPFLRVYEGKIAGREDSLVHLTLADDFMRGIVRRGDEVFLVREGMDGNLPRALQPGGRPGYAAAQPDSGEPVSCPEDHIPNNNQDAPGTNGGHRWIPPYLDPAFALGLGDSPELVARIILDADLDAYHQWGRHLPAMMVAQQVEQAATYRHQVGVQFRIVGVHLNTIAGYYPEPLDTPATFDFMEAWWGGYYRDDRDIVHLLTGQPIGTLMASCIGSAGTPYGFFYTSTSTDGTTANLRSANIIGHEIGHLFGAHHHYGNHVEAPGSATLMIQGYTPGDVPIFASVSRGVIRGWAEQYLESAGD